METIFDIKATLLRAGAQLPVKAHETDTCWDVHWCPQEGNPDTCFIPPREIRPLGTGLRVQPPQGYGLQVRSRSGMTARNQVIVLNAPGTVDANYRGELLILLANLGRANYVVHAGDRIAQVCLEQVVYGKWVVADVGTETDRGEGGMGSTGR